MGDVTGSMPIVAPVRSHGTLDVAAMTDDLASSLSLSQRLDAVTGELVVFLLPDGWFGRPNDNVYFLNKYDVSADSIDMAFDGVHVSFGRPVRVRLEPDWFALVSRSTISVRLTQEAKLYKTYDGGLFTVIHGEGLSLTRAPEIVARHMRDMHEATDR